MPTIIYVPTSSRDSVVDTGEVPNHYVEVSTNPRFVTEYVEGKPTLIASDTTVYEPHHWTLRGTIPDTWQGLVERVNERALDKGYFPFNRSDTGKCAPRFSPFHESAAAAPLTLDAHDSFTQTSVWRPVKSYFNFLKRYSNPFHKGYDSKTGLWYPYMEGGARYIGYRVPAKPERYADGVGVSTNRVETILMREVQKRAYTLVQWLWNNLHTKLLELPEDAQTAMMDAVMSTGSVAGWEAYLKALAEGDWTRAADELMARKHVDASDSTRILEVYHHWVMPHLHAEEGAEIVG